MWRSYFNFISFVGNSPDIHSNYVDPASNVRLQFDYINDINFIHLYFIVFLLIFYVVCVSLILYIVILKCIKLYICRPGKS